MSLIVEDGTGKADAESYVSADDADDYFLRRQVTVWTGSETDKEAAIRRATDYVEAVYAHRWTGRVATVDQALSWPRLDAFAAGVALLNNQIPTPLVRACCELAVRELVEPGSLAPDTSPGDRLTSVSLGPISVDFADDGNGAGGQPDFVVVDRLLAPLLGARGVGGFPNALLLRA